MATMVPELVPEPAAPIMKGLVRALLRRELVDVARRREHFYDGALAKIIDEVMVQRNRL
jgi:hypothetical protein